MNFKKILTGGLIGLTILSQSSILAAAETISYEVKSGDTYWKISQRYDLRLQELLNINGANQSSYLNVGETIKLPYDSTKRQLYKVKWGDTYWKISQYFNVDINLLLQVNKANQYSQLNVGDIVIIPEGQSSNISDNNINYHIVKAGESYWKISQLYGVSLDKLLEVNNANKYSELYIGQKIIIPSNTNQSFQNNTSTPSVNSIISSKTGPYITYTYYKVQKGDDFWKISLKFGIPQYELLKANNMNENTILYIGDTLKIPVHHIPVKETPSLQYGEYLDWWTEAQYVIPINKVFKVKDFYTGKEWTMKRTIGANHADCEPLTKYDAEIMKDVWGGSYSWNRRPVIILVDGRKIAASAASMPHSIQYITDNNFNGHMDIHFANSTRHKDGKIDYEHQENIKIAAGL